MGNIIVILLLLILTTGIITYLIRQKKRGVHCVGCPYAGQCHGTCSGKTIKD